MEKFLFLFVIIFCVSRINCESAEDDRLSRILNGRQATENQFPFMVSLQRLSGIHSATRGHRCGGVLVTLQHAVTAAECTLDWGNSSRLEPINRDEYRVFAGSVRLTNDTSPDRVRRIANTTAHPEYNMTVSRYVNNIAVIILGTPFSSNTVARLTVRDIGTAEMEQGTIIGWGSGTQLLHAPMLAINETMCRMLMGTLLPNLFCGWARYINGGYGGCQGDLGGPFVYEGRFAGVIVDTRGCSATVMPHWYVRVSRYSSWIDSVTVLPIPELGPEPATPPPPSSTTPAPASADTSRPRAILLAVVAVAQVIAANFIN